MMRTPTVFIKRTAVNVWAVSAVGLFLAGVCGCGGGNSVGFEGGLGVDPFSATLAPGQTRQFHPQYIEAVPEQVSWKIQEGEAGGTLVVVPQEGDTLNDLIAYTAPETPGTYHLQVTGTYGGGGTKTATATVEVK